MFSCPRGLIEMLPIKIVLILNGKEACHDTDADSGPQTCAQKIAVLQPDYEKITIDKNSSMSDNNRHTGVF